jgi:FkbM family methyltransferase
MASIEISWDGYKWYIERDLDRVGLSKDEISVLRAFYRIADTIGIKTFVDVGAHVGYYTIRMSKRSENVIAFEPNPMNRAKLQKNVELNELENVTIYPYALGEARYKSKLYLADSSSTLLEGYQRGPAVEVDVVPLDEVIEKADLIKIDVEGYEWKVIQGAEKLILAQRPILEIEHHDFRGYKINDYPMIRAFLKKQGYIELYLTGAHRLYYPSEKQLGVIAPLIADHWINFCILNLRQGKDWYYGLPYKWWWGMDFIDFIHEIPLHVLNPDEPLWVTLLMK